MVLAIAGVFAVLVLTLGTALFVAAEFSLVAADRAELESAVRDGDRGAERVLASLRTLSFQLSGAQLGITITTLVVGFLAEPSISRLLRPALEAAGLPDVAADTIGVIVALVMATVVQMILGELIPKNWAIARPTAVARRVAGPMQSFTATFRPLIAACNGLANVIVRGLGIEPQEELRSARSPAELGSLVQTSAADGTLPGATATLLARSLNFGARVAGDVMTPRTHIVSLPADAKVIDLLEAARTSGHSRFPLAGTVAVHADVDDITDVVHLKKAFRVERGRRADTSVSAIADRLPQVPDSLHLEPLLALLRQPGLQMALVLDEYGGTAGVVTLEDVIEELVGEVQDEHDPAARAVSDLTDGVFTVSARLRMDELPYLIPGFDPPRGPYDTLAGLVIRQLGRLAQPGDQVDLDGWVVTVLEVEGHRIDLVAIERTTAEAPR